MNGMQVSLATAYFKDGEFSSSVEAHTEAMDIYKTEVGEGKNPMLAGLADKLGGEFDVSDVLGATDLSDLLGSEELQDLLAKLGAGDLAETVEKLTKQSINKEESDPATTATATDKNNANKEEVTTGKPAQKVHEELIDIEKVRQSVLANVTSMKGEL